VSVWDCFIYGGEDDMLECRLRELDGQVYRHIVCEAPLTHRGQPKPLTFLDDLDRFRPWLDRIIYLTVPAGEIDPRPDAPALAPHPWIELSPRAFGRVKQQREYALRGLAPADPDDIVLIGDVDTIPRLGAAAAWPPYGPVVFEMRAHYFAVDWQLGRRLDVVAAPKKYVTTAWGLLETRGGLPRVRDGGWHLSWLGGPEVIRAKAAASAHAELAHLMADPGELYASGWLPWEETQQAAVDVDGTWPAWVASRQCPVSWFRPRP